MISLVSIKQHLHEYKKNIRYCHMVYYTKVLKVLIWKLFLIFRNFVNMTFLQLLKRNINFDVKSRVRISNQGRLKVSKSGGTGMET